MSSELLAPNLVDIQHTLDRVLFQSDEPIVVAIKGGWGEGKTYFWKNNYSEGHKDKRPGYVSVFGAESLSVIRERAVLAAAETLDANASIFDGITKRFPLIGSIGRAIRDSGQSWAGSLGLPQAMVAKLMEETLFKPNWVLCLDDIERLSGNIRIDAFMGYVNELRDEYELKVVLIFNDKQVGESDKKSYNKYREKVIDREIAFLPNIPDIVKLVFENEFEADAEMLPNIERQCTALGLRNIRVLMRTKSYYKEFESNLPDNPDINFLKAAFTSLLLFCWVKFAPDNNEKLTLEYLRTYSGSFRALPQDNLFESDDEADSAVEFLSKYGYRFTDDLDLILVGFVDADVLDADELNLEYQKYLTNTSRGILRTQLSSVWKKLFRGTLRNNEEELCSQLLDATRAYLDHIQLPNLDSVLSLLTRLDRTSEANSLFEEYKAKRKNFDLDLDESLFDGQAQYEPMREAILDAANRKTKDDRSIDEVVKAAVSDDFLNLRDRTRLANFSAQEFVSYFTSTDQEHLISNIRFVSGHTSQSADELDKKIHKAISEAIKVIAKKHRLNSIRMESMGLIKRQSDAKSP